MEIIDFLSRYVCAGFHCCWLFFLSALKNSVPLNFGDICCLWKTVIQKGGLKLKAFTFFVCWPNRWCCFCWLFEGQHPKWRPPLSIGRVSVLHSSAVANVSTSNASFYFFFLLIGRTFFSSSTAGSWPRNAPLAFSCHHYPVFIVVLLCFDRVLSNKTHF